MPHMFVCIKKFITEIFHATKMNLLVINDMITQCKRNHNFESYNDSCHVHHLAIGLGAVKTIHDC